MANINMRIEPGIGNTPVPNLFIDKYMPAAHPVFSCIYIYTFRHCLEGGGPITTKELANVFDILETDVVRAWQYWEEVKLVAIHEEGSEEEGSMSIEFLAIPEPSLSAKAPAPALVVKKKSIPEAGQIQLLPDLSQSPPKYGPKELALYKREYKEISSLFEETEEALGKMLNASELSTLYSFYDWLRLPLDVIRYLINYCAKNGHRQMRYIETVAINWAENNIDTVEKAENYINIFNGDYREIMKALGLTGRNPAPSEITFMEQWRAEFQLPLPVILEACDKTILALGKAQFSYTHKILESWHKAGVKSIDDVKQVEMAHKKSQDTIKSGEAKPGTRKKTAGKKSRFANFEPHDRDYDKIEKMELEYLKKSLKGTKGNGEE